MLFNTYDFVFAFLPLVTLGAWLLKSARSPRNVWLLAASVVFYAWFGWKGTALLGASTLLNWLAAAWIAARRRREQGAGAIVALAVLGNLAWLGALKYTNFAFEVAAHLGARHHAAVEWLVPLGLSFFTFQQIAYLVDVDADADEHMNLFEYTLFVGFFPKIVAGPLMRARDWNAQRTAATSRPDIAAGLTLFAWGLFQKVVLADNVAVWADAVHDAAATGAHVSVMDAWSGTLAYVVQLYFDFCGYSDMALAVGCLVGIRLPANFDSPLRATSIVDFWKRWHITMTNFFMTYVYSPLALRWTRLAMMREWSDRATFALAGIVAGVVTFVVSGIWHGAGYGFIVWGLIHGVAWSTDQALRRTKLRAPPALLGWALTMLVVATSLVFFRAPTIAAAVGILRSMVGVGVSASGVAASLVPRWSLAAIGALFAIAALAPNGQELLRSRRVACDVDEPAARAFEWRPAPHYALATALVFAVAISLLSQHQNFLYYKF